MIRFRGEGQDIRTGLNLYPWRERRTSIGFVLRWGKNRQWHVRYAPHIGRFYSQWEMRTADVGNVIAGAWSVQAGRKVYPLNMGTSDVDGILRALDEAGLKVAPKSLANRVRGMLGYARPL